MSRLSKYLFLRLILLLALLPFLAARANLPCAGGDGGDGPECVDGAEGCDSCDGESEPGECCPEDAEGADAPEADIPGCGPCEDGDTAEPGSVRWSIPFGRPVSYPRLARGRLMLDQAEATDALGTPQCLHYSWAFGTYVRSDRFSSGREVEVVRPDGVAVTYRFPAGSHEGAPTGRRHAQPSRLLALDAGLAPCAEGRPAWYERVFPNGSRTLCFGLLLLLF